MMEDQQDGNQEQTNANAANLPDDTTEISNRLENLEFVDAKDDVVVSNPAYQSGPGGDSGVDTGEENLPQRTLADKLNEQLVNKTDHTQAKIIKDSINANEADNACLPLVGKEKENTSELSGGENSVSNERLTEDENESEDEEAYHSAEEGEIVIDEENLKEIEATLTEEEKTARREEAQSLKEKGNNLFKEAQYAEAIKSYGKALLLCPLSFAKDRSIMYSNRAACHMRSENFEGAIADSTKALELNPNYLKALLRRAELYEKSEKLDEALADYTKIVEMDPSQHAARAACVRLPGQIKERNEKMKEEMLGKLKDLGNMILKPFGLSTNNFQMQQDPNTGGYSVQFNNNGR